MSDKRKCSSCIKALPPEDFKSESARTCIECLVRRSPRRKNRRQELGEQNPILVNGKEHSYCSTCNKHVQVADFDADARKTCRACRIKSKGRSKRRRQVHQLNHHTPTNTTAPELPQSIAAAQLVHDTATCAPVGEVHHNTPANSTTMDFTHTTPAIPTIISEFTSDTPASIMGLPPAVSVPSLNDQWLGVSAEPDGNDSDLT